MANKHKKRIDDLQDTIGGPKTKRFVVIDGDEVTIDGQKMTLAEWEAMRPAITDPTVEIIIFDIVYNSRPGGV